MLLMEKRLPALIEMRKKHLGQLRTNQADSAKDLSGSASNSLAASLRFLGVAEYALNKHVRAFKENLSEAALLRKNLFERFEAGEPISPSYVSMLSYKALLDALAASDLRLAKELALRMGGRNDIEREYDHPFDLSFGYALKSFVLEDASGMRTWLDAFKLQCERPENADFKGYVTVLKAILDGSTEKVSAGFVEILQGHRQQSKAGGLFNDTEDEMLCVWGIGLANLSHVRGLPTGPQEALIPSQLLA